MKNINENNIKFILGNYCFQNNKIHLKDNYVENQELLNPANW